jgi:hypothetical protein
MLKLVAGSVGLLRLGSKRRQNFFLLTFAGLTILSGSVALLSGCSAKGTVGNTSSTLSSFAVRGVVRGGQQPITGASIQLYAAGTAGDASAATPLLEIPAQTDSFGDFQISSEYICPSPTAEVYLTASSGNPGLPSGANNTAIVMMAALGQCGSLSASTFVTVNEVTTVGSLAALYPYASSISQLGSGTGDAAQFATAFALVNEYVNTATGATPGPALPGGADASSLQINALADILATCVNSSGGVAGDGSLCGNLFALVTPQGGTAPIDILGATLDILNNPSQNAAALFNLIDPNAPFQPFMSAAPTSWALSVTAAPGSPVISSFTAPPSQIGVGSSATLSWNVANAASITITPGSFSTSTLAGSTTVSPSLTTVYTLTATNASGTNVAITSVEVDSIAPTIPANLVAAATGASTISLNWAESTDAGGPGLAGYNVYRCTGPSCTPSTIVGTSATTSYADTGLTGSTSYTYAVAAYDALGLASAMSSPASATTEVATAMPTLVQHVATAMEENPVSTFTLPLPNPVGSGNALILGVQYQSLGSVALVTDDGGNDWVLGPTVTNDGQTMALYYASNAAPGTQTITITFAGFPTNVQAEASEFYNVAATAPDGMIGSSGSTTVGTITTSAAGDLIYEWGADLSDSDVGGGSYNATTSIAAGAGFTLLSADLQVGAADQFEVQPAAGEVTPTFTAPGTSTWGSLAIALQAAPGGTPPPPGIRIVHVQHTLLDSISVQDRPTPSVIQFPSSGNLLVGLFNGAQCLISKVTDSAGNPWNTSAPTATFSGDAATQCPGGAQIVYASNAVTGPTLSGITVTRSGQDTSGDDMFDLFDVTGAAPASFDRSATAYGDETSGGNLTTVSLTPSAANELVFNNTAIYEQTINGIVGTGYMFDGDVNAADDNVTGPNPTANSTLDEDNGYAHIFEPSMGTATFVYTYNSPAYGGVQYWASVSAAFAQAGSTNSTPPSVPQNLVVSGVTTSSVALSWSASTDPNYASSTLSYLIYRNGAQIGTTVGGTTSYTDAGLSPATTYTYTVSASDPIGNASAQSQAVNAVTSSSPPDNQISRR